MFFTLFFLAPIALLAALVAASIFRAYGPQGVSYTVWVGLTGAGIMGALSAIFSIQLLALNGAEMQNRMLGRQVAGVFQLTRYRHSEFPDPGQEWLYRLDPDLVRDLRPRCRVLTGASPNQCTLFQDNDDRAVRSVTLIGRELAVMDLSL